MMDLFAPANFCADRRYRWTLSRRISVIYDRPLIACGYNPSVASENADDPTIRREIALAERMRCGWLIKVNVFGAVATDPDALAGMDDPVGELNDEAIELAADLCWATGGIAVACWGTPKGRAATKRMALDRFKEVASLAPWNALRITAEGHPQHPLYLPNSAMLRPWPGYVAK